VWLIFWKMACQPCEAEAPDIAAAYAEHRSDGLVILGINAWDTVEAVRDYVRSQPEHQKQEDFQTEYRRFCEKNGKPLDERYAWD